MKLNLGCGRNPLPGYVNLDRNPAPGVELLADVETGLPFKGDALDEIMASHVLEHVVFFERALSELRRVLRIGGRLVARVPYGFNTNPFHRRYFDEKGLTAITEPHGCTDSDTSHWRLLTVEITDRGFPYWHLRKYLRRRVPIGRPKEMTFALERLA